LLICFRAHGVVMRAEPLRELDALSRVPLLRAAPLLRGQLSLTAEPADVVHRDRELAEFVQQLAAASLVCDAQNLRIRPLQALAAVNPRRRPDEASVGKQAHEVAALVEAA